MAIDSLIKGGTERRMLELIKELTEQHPSYQIMLVSMKSRVDYEYVYQLPIEFRIVEGKSKVDFSVFFRLHKTIRGFKPDVIHSWGSMASIFLAPLSKINQIPFVNGFIGRAPNGLNIRDTHYLRAKLTNPLSDAVVSNSFAGLRAYNTPQSKSHCIYNGMNLNRFVGLKDKSDMQKEVFGIDGSLSFFTIAMVAAFEDRKDHDTFLEAAILLSEYDSNIKFILVGDGKNRTRIESQTPVSLIGKNIFFLGKRDDIESIIQIADVGVLLTNTAVHGEGVANSLIEFMALGKPVIATAGGGTDEVIQDSQNGFLIESRGTKQLVEKIKFLQNNAAFALALGQQARESVLENFDIKIMAQKYISLYEAVLIKRKKL